MVNDNTRGNPLAADLEHILEHTAALWENIRGARIFVTGGTGFFGAWLLESFAWTNKKLGLGARVLVLSRDPGKFARKCPHLANDPSVDFLIGDVRDFEFPSERFDYVIHAATEASAKLNEENPLLMVETIVDGTRRTLGFARRSQARRFLYISSGAVYGKQPPDLSRIPEDYLSAPDPLDSRSAYGEGKRLSELLCSIYKKQFRIKAIIARCFAFVGPYLNLDIHYAVGNFIRDGLSGGPIRVSGDGTSFRSYMYAADLAIWLWTLLFRGEPGEAYNVGSEDAVTIKELAQEVSAAFLHSPDVVIAKTPIPGRPQEQYVPSVKKGRKELGLDVWIKLDEALRRTIAFSEQHDCAADGGT